MTEKRPLTDEEQVRIRAESVDYAKKYPFIPLVGGDVSFTCDDCGGTAVCDWVYDLYNTDGDCLAEK